ncbi:MAG: NAD(P)/FAD-dependent oxidoreductase, partial [Acidimicrobiia bacterium]
MSRRRVVVVGAGMAGLTAARRLAESCEVVVLDKGRGVGGRLATRRLGDATFDHGAQFLTTHTPEFGDAVAQWVEHGVVVPWFRGRIGPDGTTDPDGHVRYRGAQSMNAIAKHLAGGLDVRTASLVASVGHTDSGWLVSMADGAVLEADAVLMTAPVPQTLALLAAGDVELTPAETDALHAVQYDPCIALMVVLDGPSG